MPNLLNYTIEGLFGPLSKILIMHFESVQSIWFATINLIFVLGSKLGIGVFGSCGPLVFVQAMASFGFLVRFASRSRSKNGMGLHGLGLGKS